MRGPSTRQSPANRLESRFAAESRQLRSRIPRSRFGQGSEVQASPSFHRVHIDLQDGQPSGLVRNRHLDVVIESPWPTQSRIDGFQAVAGGDDGSSTTGFRTAWPIDCKGSVVETISIGRRVGSGHTVTYPAGGNMPSTLGKSLGGSASGASVWLSPVAIGGIACRWELPRNDSSQPASSSRVLSSPNARNTLSVYLTDVWLYIAIMDYASTTDLSNLSENWSEFGRAN